MVWASNPAFVSGITWAKPDPAIKHTAPKPAAD
jgi:hypothetical protein